MQISVIANWLMNAQNKLELSGVSMERCREYSQLPQEVFSHNKMTNNLNVWEYITTNIIFRLNGSKMIGGARLWIRLQLDH